MRPERLNNPKPTVGSWLKLKNEEMVRNIDAIKEGSVDLDQEVLDLRGAGYLPLGLYLEPEPGKENHEDMAYLRMVTGMLVYSSMSNEQKHEGYSRHHTYVVDSLEGARKGAVSIWVNKSANLHTTNKAIENDVWTVNDLLEKSNQPMITPFPREQMDEWVNGKDL